MRFWPRKAKRAKLDTKIRAADSRDIAEKSLMLDGVPIIQAPPEFVAELRKLGFHSPGAIYRSQPVLRDVVGLLATSIARVSFKTFERSTTKELGNHPLTYLLERPTPVRLGTQVPWNARTSFRLKRDTVIEYCLYDRAIWKKIRTSRGVEALTLYKGEFIVPNYLDGTLRYSLTGETLRPEDIVHFHGYNPSGDLDGVSPIETLRNVLMEETASILWRRWFWENAARQGGVIERPIEAPIWEDEDRERFISDWKAMAAGIENSGKTAILEEGMKWVANSFSPADAEYINGRKYNAREIVRAFHMPAFIMDLAETANFSSGSVFHDMLYQDVIPPWLEMLQSDIELQLLPEFDDPERVYVESNVKEFMRGDFLTQISAYAKAGGVPYMSVNEIRARENLPPIGDPNDPKNPFNQPVQPLNVIYGGQPSVFGGPQNVPQPDALAQASYFMEAVKAYQELQAKAAKPTDEKHIVERDGQFCVTSQDGTRDFGCYDTRTGAEARLREVENYASDDEKALSSSAARGVAIRDEYAKTYVGILNRFLDRQRQSVVSAGGKMTNRARWDKELASDLVTTIKSHALEEGNRIGKAEGFTYNPIWTDHYLEAKADNVAAAFNAATEQDLKDREAAEVFDAAAGRAEQIGMSIATSVSSFVMLEAARQVGTTTAGD